MSGHGHDHAPSAFESAFGAEEQATLKAEDSEAWNGVTGLLLFLVIGGVMLASFAVFLIYRYM